MTFSSVCGTDDTAAVRAVAADTVENLVGRDRLPPPAGGARAIDQLSRRTRQIVVTSTCQVQLAHQARNSQAGAYIRRPARWVHPRTQACGAVWVAGDYGRCCITAGKGSQQVVWRIDLHLFP